MTQKREKLNTSGEIRRSKINKKNFKKNSEEKRTTKNREVKRKWGLDDKGESITERSIEKCWLYEDRLEKKKIRWRLKSALCGVDKINKKKKRGAPKIQTEARSEL